MHDDQAYCWDFNEQGYCKHCGASKDCDEPKFVEPFHVSPVNGKWPTNTWFQKRRSKLLQEAANELTKLPQVQS